jgi:predicted CXXCH cytochrome family protein
MLAAAAVAVLVSSAGVASAAGGITGSAHDFSKWSWADGEVCKPCHTPHNAIEATVSSRLWNHTLSTAAYTLHGARLTGTGTVQDATKAGGQADMDMGSRLCLSCHDGTVALDSFGGKTGSQMAMGSISLGTDLSNDHPVGIGVIYDEMRQHGGHYSYQPLSVAKAAGARFVEVPNTTYTYTDRSGASVTSAQLAISCVSCHDVHNGAGFTDGLLRGDNAGSQLCLSCHAK